MAAAGAKSLRGRARHIHLADAYPLHPVCYNIEFATAITLRATTMGNLTVAIKRPRGYKVIRAYALGISQ